MLVSAGDMIQGLPFTNINKGADAVKLMAMAGFDTWVPGNHEFDFGTDRLLELAATATDIKLLSANVMKDGAALLSATAVFDVTGVKVGIFGLTPLETSYKTHPDNIAGVTFEDPIASVKPPLRRWKPRARK